MTRTRLRHAPRAVSIIVAFMLLTAISGVTAGCGGNQTVNLIVQIITILITRSAGGIVHNSVATLTIPPDALAADTTISLQPASSLPAADAGLAAVKGTAETFTPATTQFSTPSTLSIQYDPANLPQFASQSSVALYYVSNGTYNLVPLSVVNVTTHTVTAPVNNLGTYLLMANVPVQDPP